MALALGVTLLVGLRPARKQLDLCVGLFAHRKRLFEADAENGVVLLWLAIVLAVDLLPRAVARKVEIAIVDGDAPDGGQPERPGQRVYERARRRVVHQNAAVCAAGNKERRAVNREGFGEAERQNITDGEVADMSQIIRDAEHVDGRRRRGNLSIRRYIQNVVGNRNASGGRFRARKGALLAGVLTRLLRRERHIRENALATLTSNIQAFAVRGRSSASGSRNRQQEEKSRHKNDRRAPLVAGRCRCAGKDYADVTVDRPKTPPLTSQLFVHVDGAVPVSETWCDQLIVSWYSRIARV